jgi:glycosyltransferase involved in cell wall biosynthesis
MSTRPERAAVPRLSVGLPVYNGGRYLARSLDALLGQSYQDFELIISDNASTDDTADICHEYVRLDQRVRYHRQRHNIGSSPNHNFVVDVARGELFKWASYDDLYARDLLAECVAALDRRPECVAAHSWTANIGPDDAILSAPRYALATDSADPQERFRSVLFGRGGDDIYAVVRTNVLRQIGPQDSYHHAEHPVVAALSLYGQFHIVPDWLYFRRDHPQQAERAFASMRSRCANMDPRRADRWRNPAVRLYGEYLWGYVTAIHRAPLSSGERIGCYRQLAEWLATRTIRRSSAAGVDGPTDVPADLSVEGLVAGREPKSLHPHG